LALPALISRHHQDLTTFCELLVRDEEFEQLLDEWAEIVYCYLCQLSEKKTLVTEAFTPLAAERTGTNGSKK
jgi:hypothetical protein